MNNRKSLVIGLVITVSLFLAAGCENGGSKEYKNCGTATSLESEELGCLNKSLNNCEPAKLKVETEDQGINMEYLVEGGEPENCKVTWKIIKGGEKYSKLEGEQITCTITKIRENGLPAISEAYDNGNCGPGTAPEKFNYYLGGFGYKGDEAEKDLLVTKCNAEKDELEIKNTGSTALEEPKIRNAKIYKYDKEAEVHEFTDPLGKLQSNTVPNKGMQPGEKTLVKTTADFKKGKDYAILIIIGGASKPITTPFTC